METNRRENDRSVDELLDATTSAPTFGLNARELILQAARRIAQDTSEAVSEEEGNGKLLLSALYRKGPELLQAIPKEERPLVPFKAVQRSKVPRITRQAVLERLTGQHLALALQKAGLPIQATEIPRNKNLRKQATEAAVAQEEELFERGKASKSVYLNYAVRTNAGLWERALEGEIATLSGAAGADGNPRALPALRPDGKHPSLPREDSDVQFSVQATQPANNHDPILHIPRPASTSKRRKLVEQPVVLMEVDIDWDSETTGNAGSAKNDSRHAPLQSPVNDDTRTEEPTEQEEARKPTKVDSTNPPSEPENQNNNQAPKSAKVSQIAQPAVALQPPIREPQQPTVAISGENCTGKKGSQEGRLAKKVQVQQPSSEGLEEYSPSRHGGESPPTESTTATAPKEARKVVGSFCQDAKVVSSVEKFLRSYLDPLYQAQVITKAVYKGAMQRTMDKVLRLHPNATDAKFLVPEGAKIHKLLTQYIQYVSERTQ